MSLLSEICKIVFKIKIDNCEGCFYKSSSQIRHDCLRDFYDLIYFEQAIKQLENKLKGVDINKLREEWLKK